LLATSLDFSNTHLSSLTPLLLDPAPSSPLTPLLLSRNGSYQFTDGRGIVPVYACN